MQFGHQNVLQLIENVTIFGDTCYSAGRNCYLNKKKDTPFHKKAQRMFLYLTKLSTFFILFVDRRSDLTWHQPKDLGYSVAFSSFHK